MTLATSMACAKMSISCVVPSGGPENERSGILVHHVVQGMKQACASSGHFVKVVGSIFPLVLNIHADVTHRAMSELACAMTVPGAQRLHCEFCFRGAGLAASAYGLLQCRARVESLVSRWQAGDSAL